MYFHCKCSFTEKPVSHHQTDKRGRKETSQNKLGSKSSLSKRIGK